MGSDVRFYRVEIPNSEIKVEVQLLKKALHTSNAEWRVRGGSERQTELVDNLF